MLDNAAVLELAFGLIVAAGVLLLTLVLPIMSFIRAQQARRIAIAAANAQAIVPFCDQVDEVDDLLTLTGLKLIWERNRA